MIPLVPILLAYALYEYLSEKKEEISGFSPVRSGRGFASAPFKGALDSIPIVPKTSVLEKVSESIGKGVELVQVGTKVVSVVKGVFSAVKAVVPLVKVATAVAPTVLAPVASTVAPVAAVGASALAVVAALAIPAAVITAGVLSATRGKYDEYEGGKDAGWGFGGVENAWKMQQYDNAKRIAHNTALGITNTDYGKYAGNTYSDGTEAPILGNGGTRYVRGQK